MYREQECERTMQLKGEEPPRVCSWPRSILLLIVNAVIDLDNVDGSSATWREDETGSEVRQILVSGQGPLDVTHVTAKVTRCLVVVHVNIRN